MQQLKTIMDTNPGVDSLHQQTTQLYETIKTLAACEQSCVACADACLNEDEVQQLTQCIRLNLLCATDCNATARTLLSSNTGSSMVRAQLELCMQACRACGEECERHAQMHEHCRACAEVCRACEQACREALAPVAV